MKVAHNARDIGGQRFGMLVAIDRAPSRHGNAYWRFRCDCGSETIAMMGSVLRGDAKSCGCHRRAVSGKLNLRHGESDQRRNRLYRIWSQMIRRCETPSLKAYARYGGRGIRVCAEWRQSYEAFRDWALSNGYAPDLSIDRVDNDGHYQPANCRWATAKQQARNRG